MKINFTSDTYPTNCVYELSSELNHLELHMNDKIPGFPFEIGVALRCLPDSIGRKTFRRFDVKNNCLTVDITVSQDKFKLMSKNEQREACGLVLFNCISESLSKQKAPLSQEDLATFMLLFEKWLRENGWLNGVSEKAKELLRNGSELFDVAKQLKIPLSEVELYYCEVEGISPTSIHPDNL